MAESTELRTAEKTRELLKQAPLDKIRVTEICRAAGIVRLPLDYRFRDRYGLVARMFCRPAAEAEAVSPASSAPRRLRMRTV